jgi:DtxR family Mn-dependent transcriptional regulator
MMTIAEQEYLKQIYLYTSKKEEKIHTKELAEMAGTKPASVSAMIKRLAAKNLIIYKKYQGCSLSAKGLKDALQIIRRSRLWELFLVEKMGMDWKEVYPIASQLQGISSKELINKIELFLGHPTYDPHGEVIPDTNGKLPATDFIEVYDLKINQPAIVFGYRDTGKSFLQYIEKLQLLIGASLEIISAIEYDQSLEILVDKKYRYIISKESSQKIYVTTNGTSRTK